MNAYNENSDEIRLGKNTEEIALELDHHKKQGNRMLIDTGAKNDHFK